MRLQKGTEKKEESQGGLHGGMWLFTSGDLEQRCKVPPCIVLSAIKKSDRYLRMVRKTFLSATKGLKQSHKMLKDWEKHTNKIQSDDQQSLPLQDEPAATGELHWLQWAEGGDRFPPYCFAPVRFIKIRGGRGRAGAEQGRSSLGALRQNGMMVMMWNGSEAGRRIGCDHCVVVAQADCE